MAPADEHPHHKKPNLVYVCPCSIGVHKTWPHPCSCTVANSRNSDPSGAEIKTVRTSRAQQLLATELTVSQEDDVATAILKKKKKPNQLM